MFFWLKRRLLRAAKEQKEKDDTEPVTRCTGCMCAGECLCGGVCDNTENADDGVHTDYPEHTEHIHWENDRYPDAPPEYDAGTAPEEVPPSDEVQTVPDRETDDAPPVPDGAREFTEKASAFTDEEDAGTRRRKKRSACFKVRITGKKRYLWLCAANGFFIAESEVPESVPYSDAASFLSSAASAAETARDGCPRFVVKKEETLYRFYLYGEDGSILLTSHAYRSAVGCRLGIGSAKRILASQADFRFREETI